MHTRTIAALLMSTIKEAMEATPPDIPTIVSNEANESGNISALAGVSFSDGSENPNSFVIILDDSSQFRVDVIRIS